MLLDTKQLRMAGTGFELFQDENFRYVVIHVER